MKRAKAKPPPPTTGTAAGSFPLKPGTQLKNWVIREKLGSGACSEVYLAEDKITSSKSGGIYALKVSSLPPAPASSARKKRKKTDEERAADTLYHEHLLYRGYFQDFPNIPQLPHNAFGEDKGFRFLGIQLLWKDLEAVKEAAGSINPQVAAKIGLQILRTLEFLHSKRFLFVDMKPANFMLGRPQDNKQETVFAVDFGLCEKFVTLQGKHRPRESGGIAGTPTFLSLDAHSGLTPSRKDDIESLGYIMVYLMNGDLPWDNVNSNEEGLSIKKRTDVGKLCEGLPGPFLNFIEDVKGLDYEEKPDYDKLAKYLEKVMAKPMDSIKIQDCLNQSKSASKGHKSVSAPKKSKSQSTDDSKHTAAAKDKRATKKADRRSDSVVIGKTKKAPQKPLEEEVEGEAQDIVKPVKKRVLVKADTKAVAKKERISKDTARAGAKRRGTSRSVSNAQKIEPKDTSPVKKRRGRLQKIAQGKDKTNMKEEVNKAEKKTENSQKYTTMGAKAAAGSHPKRGEIVSGSMDHEEEGTTGVRGILNKFISPLSYSLDLLSPSPPSSKKPVRKAEKAAEEAKKAAKRAAECVSIGSKDGEYDDFKSRGEPDSNEKVTYDSEEEDSDRKRQTFGKNKNIESRGRSSARTQNPGKTGTMKKVVLEVSDDSALEDNDDDSGSERFLGTSKRKAAKPRTARAAVRTNTKPERRGDSDEVVEGEYEDDAEDFYSPMGENEGRWGRESSQGDERVCEEAEDDSENEAERADGAELGDGREHGEHTKTQRRSKRLPVARSTGPRSFKKLLRQKQRETPKERVGNSSFKVRRKRDFYGDDYTENHVNVKRNLSLADYSGSEVGVPEATIGKKNDIETREAQSRRVEDDEDDWKVRLGAILRPYLLRRAMIALDSL